MIWGEEEFFFRLSRTLRFLHMFGDGFIFSGSVASELKWPSHNREIERDEEEKSNFKYLLGSRGALADDARQGEEKLFLFVPLDCLDFNVCAWKITGVDFGAILEMGTCGGIWRLTNRFN